jgi:hypothetical protein
MFSFIKRIIVYVKGKMGIKREGGNGKGDWIARSEPGNDKEALDTGLRWYDE